MKKLLLIICLFHLIGGCSYESKKAIAQRQITKKLNKYPELKRADTTIFRIETIRPEIQFARDTFMLVGDTIVIHDTISGGEIRTVIKEIKNDSIVHIWTSFALAPDTVVIEKECISQAPIIQTNRYANWEVGLFCFLLGLVGMFFIIFALSRRRYF